MDITNIEDEGNGKFTIIGKELCGCLVVFKGCNLDIEHPSAKNNGVNIKIHFDYWSYENKPM